MTQKCEHLQMHYDLNLQHFGNTNIRYLEIRGRCTACGAKAVFRGPTGISPDRPTVSIDGQEANVPMLFEGEKYDGRAIGFTVAGIEGRPQ